MKDIPTSPRIALIKHNRQVRRVRLLVLFTVLFIVVIGFLSYFSSNPRVTISKIVISGNSIVDGSKLESNIKEKISGKYWKLFSRANFLIYPRSTIYSSLQKEFPRIEKLSIKLEGFNTLKVDIRERAGSYLYCGESVPEKKEDIGENCYFVNNDGYIFDRAPYFSGNIYFKFYKKIDTGKSPLGLQMLSPERFHEVMRLIDGVSSLGFKPYDLVLSQDGIHSIYLESKNNNPKIIFKEDNDLSVILDNFVTAMNQKEFAKEINSKYDTLSYIDLRFNNKVLYKFQ